MNLAVITACTKPAALPFIYQSLGDEPVHWIVVADLMRTSLHAVSSAINELSNSIHKITLLHCLDLEKDHCGGQCVKNRGIDHVENISKDRYIYIIDDDNIMHPNFYKHLGEFIKIEEGPDLICFWQELEDGWFRDAKPIISGIDQAQYIFKTSSTWGLRIPEAYSGDGVFVSILAHFGRSVKIIPEVACYYNKLSDFKSLPGKPDLRWTKS